MRLGVRNVAVVLLLSSAAACGGSSSSPVGSDSPSVGPSATSPVPVKPDIDVALGADDAPQNPYVAYGSLWVAAHHTKAVLRLDLTSGKTIARIKTGAVEPGGITAGHGLVWVT